MNYKIHELCSINAYNLTKNDDWDYIYYLDTANLNEGTISDLKLLRRGIDKIPSRAKRKVKNNDILLSTVRPSQKHYGIMKNIPNRLIASTGFAVLTPNEELVYPEYLYRCLTQDKIILFLQAVAETSTSAYPLIKPSVIGDLEIELPSLEEQKAIAHILSTLDEKIELNKKINKTLEDIAQAIFKHWFVDFEFPNEDGEPYKSSGGEMVESELGMIPKGWEVKKFGELVKIHTKSIKPFENPEETFEHYSIPAFDLQGFPEFDKGAAIRSNKYQVLEESILISKLNPRIKRIWLPLNITKMCVCSTEFINYIPRNKKLRNFCYSVIDSCGFNDFLVQNATGSTNSRQRVKPRDMLDYLISLPYEESLLLSFDKIIAPFYALVNKNKIEIEFIKRLRDTLLPKLMSGEIRVPLDQEGDCEEVS
jgi:type I restriction enzyme S subunit